MTLPPFLGFLQKESSHAPVFLCTGNKVSTGSAPSYSIFSLYYLNSCFNLPTSVAPAAAILHVSVQL